MSKQCKDCVHYNICEEWADRTNHAYYQYGSYCEQFKDKSRFVESKRKLQNNVYVLIPTYDEKEIIVNAKIVGIDFCDEKHSSITAQIENSTRNLFEFSVLDIGKTVFLTREEAEKALKDTRE